MLLYFFAIVIFFIFIIAIYSIMLENKLKRKYKHFDIENYEYEINN